MMYRIHKRSQNILGTVKTEFYEVTKAPDKISYRDCEVKTDTTIKDENGNTVEEISRFIPLIEAIEVKAASREDSLMDSLEVAVKLFNQKYIKCLPQRLPVILKVTTKREETGLTYNLELHRTGPTFYSLKDPVPLRDASDVFVSPRIVSPEQFTPYAQTEVFPDYPLNNVQITGENGSTWVRNNEDKIVRFEAANKRYTLFPGESTYITDRFTRIKNSKYQKRVPETLITPGNSDASQRRLSRELQSKENFFMEYSPVSKTSGVITTIGVNRPDASWGKSTFFQLEFPGGESAPLQVTPVIRGGRCVAENVPVSFSEPPAEVRITVQEFSKDPRRYRSTLSLEHIFGDPEVLWGKLSLQRGTPFRLSFLGTTIKLPEYHGRDYDADPFGVLPCVLNIKGVLTQKGQLLGSYWTRTLHLKPERGYITLPDEVYRVSLPKDTQAIIMEVILVGEYTSHSTVIDSNGGV